MNQPNDPQSSNDENGTAADTPQSGQLSAPSDLPSATGDTPPSDDAICQFLNTATAHVASQANIPAALRPALFQAEANCRANEGDVMSVATIDGERLVKVPDDCEKQSLFRFLWEALVDSGGESIWFGFVGDDDRLWVIYMDRDQGYVASASIEIVAGEVVIGDWTVQAMKRS